MQYRREIDGLRAVAVVPVILFHAGFEVFSGGFVGVDIFFVISGYLITSILLNDLAENKFSLVHFYERRARRILPALFFVILCCFPVAWFLLLPRQMEAFTDSIFAVALFGSNILFWREAGYFAPASELKPLLHTWSLSVEEQYYVIFPLFLLLIWRFKQRTVLLILCGTALLSLGLSEWASTEKPTANFYLAPTRAWELLAGSICALLTFGRRIYSNNYLSSLGLLAIMFSIFYYDNETPFPSLYALAPVIGTSLIILFGTRDTFAGKLLSFPVFVFIGLISYSAYLWHQPIFAFARVYNIGKPDDVTMLSLGVASFVLAFLTWKFIEQPFRKGRGSVNISRRAIFTSAACVMLAAIGIGVSGKVTQGFESRFPNAASFLAHFENGKPDYAYFERIGLFEAYRDECNFYERGVNEGDTKADIAPECHMPRNDQDPIVFVWGDSTAQQFHKGLSVTLPADVQLLQVASSQCGPALRPEDETLLRCRRSNSLALRAIEQHAPEVVLLGYADKWTEEALGELTRTLRGFGVGKIVILGTTPRWETALPRILVRTLEDIPRRTMLGLNQEFIAHDEEMKALHANGSADIAYFSVLDILCNADGCLTHLGDDFPSGITSWDRGHITPHTSEHVARAGLSQLVLDMLSAAREEQR